MKGATEMAVNYFSVKKKIKGKEYTAQFNGVSQALRAVDDTYIPGSKNTSLEKLTEYVLTNVIVNPPNLTADDFDDVDELNAVVGWGTDVMNGKFRPTQKPKSGKTAGTE